jgi:hypothetical protein
VRYVDRLNPKDKSFPLAIIPSAKGVAGTRLPNLSLMFLLFCGNTEFIWWESLRMMTKI